MAETQQSIKDLIDPRAISKKSDPQGRSVTAATIWQSRKQASQIKEGIKSLEAKQEMSDQQEEELIEERVQRSRQLREAEKKILARLIKAIGIKDKGLAAKKAYVDFLDNKAIVSRLESDQAREDGEALRKQLEASPKGKDILQAYYEKVETTPLSNQEKRELLKPEVLACLDEQEYIRLWRRLNPYFLAHVTRQGFRDHNAMVFHSAGLEEFHEGFVNTLKDGKLLRPPMALNGLRHRDEKSVEEYMAPVLEAPDQKSANEQIEKFFNFSLASAPKYPDETAVHFAAQVVAADYYGGERKNEVFFLYPSDVLASQQTFAFNGWEKDFTQPQSERKWNDVFVWPNELENPGISLDIGFVFLPEHTPVDPETGSKYASEIKMVDGQEKRVVVEDKNLIDKFLGWVPNQDVKNFEGSDQNKIQFVKAELVKIGFNPDAAEVFAPELLEAIIYSYGGNSEERIKDKFMKSTARLKRAENPILAKDYWESFFAKNPTLRPKHVHYYDGSPTVAVYDFQQKNNIGQADTSKTEGRLLGFDDHHVSNMSGDQRAWLGYYQLQDTANKIIAEHYS